MRRTILAFVLLSALVLLVVRAGLFSDGRESRSHELKSGYKTVNAKSDVIAGAPDRVLWMWSGGVTPTSITIKAKVLGDASRAVLLVSETAEFRNPIRSSVAEITGTSGSIASMSIAGLVPGRRYFYQITFEGDDDVPVGEFSTPEASPFSFKFALSGDAVTGSSHQVFRAIAEEKPFFYLILGDLFYANINTSNIGSYLDAYDLTLSSAAQSRLYRTAPVAYMWDDHDYADNNSDKLAKGRESARIAYQLAVPHYPLPDQSSVEQSCENDDRRACNAIYQSFFVGNAYFILTDLRSERDSRHLSDTAAKTMLGERQKEWFKQQLLHGSSNYAVTFWVSTVPYIEEKEQGSDGWGGYSNERREIADYLRKHSIDNLIILAADAHMIALDDGSHSDYSSSDEIGQKIPVFHAAALNKRGSTKGGPYSHGTFPNPEPNTGQYGLVHVVESEDEGTCVSFDGKRVNSSADKIQTLLTWQRCFTDGSAKPLSGNY